MRKTILIGTIWVLGVAFAAAQQNPDLIVVANLASLSNGEKINEPPLPDQGNFSSFSLATTSPVGGVIREFRLLQALQENPNGKLQHLSIVDAVKLNETDALLLQIEFTVPPGFTLAEGRPEQGRAGRVIGANGQYKGLRGTFDYDVVPGLPPTVVYKIFFTGKAE